MKAVGVLLVLRRIRVICKHKNIILTYPRRRCFRGLPTLVATRTRYSSSESSKLSTTRNGSCGIRIYPTVIILCYHRTRTAINADRESLFVCLFFFFSHFFAYNRAHEHETSTPGECSFLIKTFHATTPIEPAAGQAACGRRATAANL